MQAHVRANLARFKVPREVVFVDRAAPQRDRKGAQAGAAGREGLSVASLGRMAPATVLLDLASLRLSPGEGRRLSLEVPIEELELGSESYQPEPSPVPVEVECLAHERRRLCAAPALHRRRHGAVHALPRRGRPAGRGRGPRGRPARLRRGARQPLCRGRDARPRLAGRGTRSRWRCPRRSSAGRTARGCARCAPPTSTRPVPSTTTSSLRIPAGPSCASCDSSSGHGPAGSLPHSKWRSPRKSSRTAAPPSGVPSTGSTRRRSTPARSATAPADPTGSAPCAASMPVGRSSPRHPSTITITTTPERDGR